MNARLSERQRQSLEAVRHGADVYAYAIACDLREIERTHPGLVDICRPRAYDGDGTDTVPYFGARATAEGCAVLDDMRLRDDLPPCEGEAIRDITYDIFRRGCGEED